MREVAATLWIGNAFEARDMHGVLAAGIKAVVDLAIGEPPVSPVRDLISIRVPLSDGDGNPEELILLAVSTVTQLLTRGVPTLVACSAGMSRAPVISAAALSQWAESDIATELDKITTSGPCDVSPAFFSGVRSVIRFAK